MSDRHRAQDSRRKQASPPERARHLQVSTDVLREGGRSKSTSPVTRVDFEPRESEYPTSSPLDPEASLPPPLPKPPAHRLLAQLQHVSPPAAEISAPPEEHEISSARIEIVDEPVAISPARQLFKDSVWGLGIGLVSLILLAGAYVSANWAPVPEPSVDPALTEKRARLEHATKALERGHGWAVKGKASADQAIVAYKEAISYMPKLAAAQRGLAIAYTSKGLKEKAVRHYRQYLKLDPDAHDAEEVRAILARWQRENR